MAPLFLDISHKNIPGYRHMCLAINPACALILIFAHICTSNGGCSLMLYAHHNVLETIIG